MLLHRASSMKEWRRKIKAKSGEYCKLCGSKGNEAHHIATRHHKRYKLVIENGIYLCSGCHKFVHEKVNKAQKIIKSIIDKEIWEKLQKR